MSVDPKHKALIQKQLYHLTRQRVVPRNLMNVARTIEHARECVANARRKNNTIGLVPTMGALHDGHFSLIRQCRAECGYAVVSIFVNPTQFGPNEDLSTYPRTFNKDKQACEELGVDLIFAPETEEIYPFDPLTRITVKKLTDHLCGTTRKTHFPGVCLVVAKLFNIIQPDAAYFGQKDAQQLAVISRMVQDLNFPVEIRPCPTIREPDGLARSSRNKYLSPKERRQATCLSRALQTAKDMIRAGQIGSSKIIAAMTEIVRVEPDAVIDYISIVDMELLQPVARVDRPVLIALAVRFDSARLIDNIIIDPFEMSR